MAGYNKDVVFLVIPDELEFSQHVPIVIGTCTLERIINVIKESEMDRLSTPWAMVRASCLLSWWGTVVQDLGMASNGPMEERATAVEPPTDQDLNEPVFMKENVDWHHFRPRYWSARSNHSWGEVLMSW